MSNVRMDWTVDEFYANGGVTSFVDRVAASLGIHASQFKVVAVYTGSVVVDYQIEVDTSNTGQTASQQLSSIESSLNAVISSGESASVFGAPVLSASTGDTVVVEDPAYAANGGVPVAADISQNRNSDQYDKPDVIVLEDEPEIEEQKTLTITDDGIQINMTDAQKTSLIVILVVVGVLMLCCFGVGFFLICTYQLGKASKEVYNIR